MTGETGTDGGQVTILGIVNLTEDSFSDGGRYLDPAAAIDHALRLVEEGADVIDLGAASSHPEARTVSGEEEIRRLAPVLGDLVERGICVSVDSWRTPVQRFALTQGAAYLNDIRGFADPSFYRELAESDARLIAMHSIARSERATRQTTDAQAVFDGILAFFDERVGALAGAGIDRTRVVLDPGMGLFLGADPAPSIMVLRRLGELCARYGCDVLVSVSRKSFVGRLAGGRAAESVGWRDAATLGAELFAVERGATFIRTHEPRLLRDAVAVHAALRET
ncbi:MAG: dihydropteroate synthase [Deltaproteobacteria bacterium]|nr:dihydropteroate synthase [Deltaproteobacteria bacterium]